MTLEAFFIKILALPYWAAEPVLTAVVLRRTGVPNGLHFMAFAPS